VFHGPLVRLQSALSTTITLTTGCTESIRP
jgi:hypothetical protein